MSSDAAGDAARDRVVALLDEAVARSRTIDFWWRDDDAEDATPALDHLLALARSHSLPLGLAVVPKGATGALAARLKSEPSVAVLQHGWAHKNHAAVGEKKIELGGVRPVSEVLKDLGRGFDRLQGLFAEQFLPVLVPPWNRISDAVREARSSLGLAGLSTSGPVPAGEPHQVNVHVDIFAWRPTRRPLSRAEGYERLGIEVERRLAGAPEPLGIMTHHLVHEAASWALLDEMLAMLTEHRATRWPEVRQIFDL